MAHPVFWSPQIYFYPIGNTPAISLAEYLPPDEDGAILAVRKAIEKRSFTYLAFNRALDFTFCDNEPSVLARNIFIYTLLFDQCDDETIQCLWKIYFDIFVDKPSYDLIVSHCKTLLQLSNSLEDWESSSYGAAIRFCTKDTLAAVRGYWNLYLFKDQNPTAMKAGVLQEMKKVAKSVNGAVATAMRSAGIMAMKMTTFGPEHFKHYWKHGVTGTELAEISSATRVNPTLFYSSAGNKFNVHYGTDPILCFHLALALAPIQNIQGTPAQDMAAMISAIKSQFFAWGRSFHNQMNSAESKIQLRFFTGNAMTLCKALRYTAQTGYLDTPEYTNAWGGSTISFVADYLPDSSRRPPLTFSVIETSNIADHLGFLNLLLIAAPLLKRDTTSVLFTHSLLASKGSERHVSALQTIGVEVPLLSLLFGLVPERTVSQTTSQSISQELFLSAINESPQNLELNCWRVSAPEAPSQGYTFTCDSTELGNTLFSAYLKMFEDEGIGGSMRALKTLKHYTRDTFIELLCFVKDTYTGDWEPVMNRVMESIERDTTLIVGMNNYQDLCRGLEQAGLFKIVPDPKSFASAPRDFCFQGWEDIPKVVCVVLVVPRDSIQRLLDDSDGIQTPTLECEVRLINGHSVFTAFQPVFGTIEELDSAPTTTKNVVIREDPDGWRGKSDLIVHFLAPAWLFVQRPASEIKMGLNIKSSYVEVEGRVNHTPKVPVDLNPFPVVVTPNGPHQLSMHYLALDNLPAFRSPFPNVNNDLSSWLNPHFLLSMAEEKKAAETSGKPAGLLDMKESVVHIFLNYFEKFKGKPALMNLADPENGGVYTMIFVSCVRVDLTSHTIVADACILPLTIPLISQKSFQKALQDLQKGSSSNNDGMQAQIKTPEHEVPWWQAFLPTVVERCRTWNHNSNKCEYKSEGRVPRSLKMGEDPLCSCGRGKNLGQFDEIEEWRAFRPHVTRAAIGFPFPTSAQGNTAAELKGMFNESKKEIVDKEDSCKRCKQPGKPKLLVCSRCKGVKYCSAQCQKADWKAHKGVCVQKAIKELTYLAFDRAFDFTFCDNEPSILARNIFIYTLLFDQCDDETIQCLWKIYLDIFVDKPSYDLIVSHCRRLLKLSNSLEEWESSPYGAFIKFCTKDTLAVIRRYWNLYLFKDQSPTAMKASVLKEMEKVAKSVNGDVATALRSAGIMALQMYTFGPHHYKHYWKHGVTGTEPTEISSATHVNPTLLYSSAGNKFNVHYGTDPILCFHLTPALVPMQNIQGTPAQDMAAIISAIKSQFFAWGRSFHNQMNSANSKVQLRFFAGNAMTLCKALRYVAQTGYLDTPEYTNTWGGSTISFVDDYLPDSSTHPPLTFNVIETSNIADHLGFLNVLLIAAPLLKRDTTSVLFTHSLLASRDGRHVSVLQKIGVEVPFLSLLFGLVPERTVFQTTSQSISQELVLSAINDSPPNRELNCWRVSAPEAPSQGYTFNCDATELGNTLFSAYLNIFEDEGLGGAMYAMQKPKHYIRDTFIELLCFVKDAYTGDWKSVMDRIIDSIERDTTLMVGRNYYQDLCRGLEQAGLHEIVPDPNWLAFPLRDFCFQGWEDIPKVICVVLVVPRYNIQRLLDDSDGIQTPTLQCEIKLVNGHNAFTAFQPVFGTIEKLDPAPTTTRETVVIREDPDGWQGKSDLIVHFFAPAWILVRPASEINIGLNMFGMRATMCFMSKLGMHLSIYSTTLKDKKRAFILRDRPRVASQVSQDGSPGLSAKLVQKPTPLMHGIVSRQPVSLKFQGTRVASFTIRCSITDERAKSTLSDKATQVEAKPISVTAIRVSFKGFESTIHFPYPVVNSSLVTRIARKSSYIEVEGRVAQSPKVPAELNPFPVIVTPNGPCQLSMHYLALDNLPAFRSPFSNIDNTLINGLKLHFLLSTSDEKKAADSVGKTSGLLEIKDSVMYLFLHFFEEWKGKPTLMKLVDPENRGVYTMIFVTFVSESASGSPKGLVEHQ
ncbi:hypothetical protein EST38_g392 [Candolleomyces aberdarensis]|uniref:MYND-type domain-containing protein n=1 Tax=Candolleomyces aberdarensis TaxID=2316362 RepID=A0A4Q2E1Z2_9AGAR|nr:hypothetical protein EST38_g392 [Candolleomyces aberdarensis]